MPDLRDLAEEDFCYLTTTGRVTGRPHEIEIWFSLVPESQTLYMLSGGGDRSDWVKNLRRNPEVMVRIAGERFGGLAREAKDAEEDELARDRAARGGGPRERVRTAAGGYVRLSARGVGVRDGVRIQRCSPEQLVRKTRRL